MNPARRIPIQIGAIMSIGRRNIQNANKMKIAELKSVMLRRNKPIGAKPKSLSAFPFISQTAKGEYLRVEEVR